jgi:hypothetical protein
MARQNANVRRHATRGGAMMNAAMWGYATGVALMMYVFFLIFLGLLALIPTLRQRFAVRNVVAWTVAALSVGFLSASGGGPAMPVIVAALVSGGVAGLRYWNVMRKQKVMATPTGREA